MKKYLAISITALSLTALIAGSCSSDSKGGKDDSSATFKGQLKNSNGDTLFLVNVSSGKREGVDTTVTDEQGNFTFHNKLPVVGYYNLEVGSTGFVTIILDPSKTDMLTGDAKNLAYTWNIEHSEDNANFKEFNDYATTFQKTKAEMVTKLQQIRADYEVQANLYKNNKPKLDELEKSVGDQFNAIQDSAMRLDNEAIAYIRGFIQKHPASMANIPALYLPEEPQAREQLIDPYNNIDLFEQVAQALQKKYPDAPNPKLLADQVAKMKPFGKGALAPDITLNDPNGKPIALSSLRGKVVLLDFWASWCAPCRAELPNVVEAYKKYNAKGFDVYSVSLDKDKSQWTGAIKSDGLVWKNHVSDLGYWQSSVVPLYGIEGIPLTFLLDKDGKIIARGLRGIALQQKLDELFKS